MAVVINTGNGKTYVTWPERFRAEIGWLQNPGFEYRWNVLLILSAVYDANNYRIETNPVSQGNIWEHYISSPVIKETIHITMREISRDNRQQQRMNWDESIDEYTIRIGNIWTITTEEGILAYYCHLLTGQERQKYDGLDGKKLAQQQNRKSLELLDTIVKKLEPKPVR